MEKQNRIIKWIYIILGTICISLGIIGIVVPLLPTTPFLLLATALFLKSSSKLYLWLVNHKLLGFYIKNYLEHKAISRFSKVLTLILLWGTISFSALVVIDKLWLQILLFAIAIGVSIHILKLNTISNKNKDTVLQNNK